VVEDDEEPTRLLGYPAGRTAPHRRHRPHRPTPAAASAAGIRCRYRLPRARAGPAARDQPAQAAADESPFEDADEREQFPPTPPSE